MPKTELKKSNLPTPPLGKDAEGLIVQLFDDAFGEQGQHAVVTRVDYTEHDNSMNYKGYLYMAVKCTPEGTINGGVIQYSDRDVCLGNVRSTGKLFWGTHNPCPFDDDIPF